MKAVGYVRVSRVGSRGGDSFLSPDLQREQIAAAAAREGMTIVEVLEELDASGGDASRPLWNEAIRRVESGEAAAVVVWNLSRFSRSVRDALDALGRVEAAGGRLVSATETFGDDPAGRLTRNVLLSIAEMERERAKAGFREAASSAIERGVFIGARVPLGYRRGADRRLEVDPDTAPVVQGMFERRAQGWSWARLATWAVEQGCEMTDKGAFYLVHNPTYLGQARWGDVTRDDAHPAIVTKALWRRCQEKAKRSARTGKLTGKFLLQGVATCAACGRALYLSSGGRKRDNPFYYCRNPQCGDRAYANARRLDDHVVTVVMGELEAQGPEALYVARPGDDREVEEAGAAVTEAQADLDGFLADTRLRGILGADAYANAASNYVAVLNKCRADLEAARERHTGRFALLGHMWLQEWGIAERREWLSRMVRACEVAKGREPLSKRVTLEL